MSSARRLALLILLAAGISSGQVSPDWEQWVADGLIADDNSEYKESERLLGQACDVSIAADLGSERLTRACLLLWRTVAAQGKWQRAGDTVADLIGALRDLPDRRDVDLVSALIEAAGTSTARADFPAANQRIREALALIPKLNLEDAAIAYADASVFFLPNDPGGSAEKMLTIAVKALQAHPLKNSIGFARAALRVSTALRTFNRSDEALPLLRAVVEQAELRTESGSGFEEHERTYRSAASMLIEVLEQQGDKQESARIETLMKGWPQTGGESAVEVTAPSLTLKVEPQLSPGAKSRGLAGLVVLSAEIQADGRAHDIEILQPFPMGLSWQALGAIRKWRFKPGTRNGEAVSVLAQIEVRFRLR